MAFRKTFEGIQLGRDSEGVNCQDGARARRDCAFHGSGVEIERHGIHFNENRRGAYLKDGVNHGHEGKRGKDDFIAFAHTKREQS